MKKIILKKTTLRFYQGEDEELLAWLQNKQNNGGYTLNELIKLILKSAVIKKCPKFNRGTELQKYIYEINKIGNNLNQIAKKVNFSKKLDNKVLEEMGKIRAELQQLNKKIKG